MRLSAVAAVSAILLLSMAVLPMAANGQVILNDPVAVNSGHVYSFAPLNNSTTSLSRNKVDVSSYGSQANVTMSGTWKGSNMKKNITADGFIAQNLRNGNSASTWITVSYFNGMKNLSYLDLYATGSGATNTTLLKVSGGKLTASTVHVGFTSLKHLNFSMKYSARSNSRKVYQSEDVHFIIGLETTTGNGFMTITQTMNVRMTLIILT